MFDPILVMKSCRDNGQFETDPQTLEGKDNAFRFFTPHYPVSGTVTVFKDTACIFFDDKAFQKVLTANIPLPQEADNIASKGNGWVIKGLPSVHAFWKNVRQILVSPPPSVPKNPISESGNNGITNWKTADFDPSQDAEAKTEEERLQKIRKGQEIYRKRQEILWDKKCAVTGIATRSLLRASHAVPWKDCKSGEERLDPYNGFLLSVSLDALFDVDLISFDDTGKILINPSIPSNELAAIGIHPELKLRFVNLRHRPYLAIQRERFKAKQRR